MTTTNNRILKLYKSRVTLIDQLENLDYDISEYHSLNSQVGLLM